MGVFRKNEKAKICLFEKFKTRDTKIKKNIRTEN